MKTKGAIVACGRSCTCILEEDFSEFFKDSSSSCELAYARATICSPCDGKACQGRVWLCYNGDLDSFKASVVVERDDGSTTSYAEAWFML